MRKNDQQEFGVNRRNFLKTTAIAGMAAALPTASLIGQTAEKVLRTRRSGGKKKLLFLNNSPQQYGKLIESIQSIPGVDLLPVTAANFKTPEEVVKSIQRQDPDIVLTGMLRTGKGMSSEPMVEALGPLDIPVIMLPDNLDLIMIEADVAAALRMKGLNVMLANSQAQATELAKILATPGILEGKRAIIYGKPFDSTSVPAHNLNEESIYKRTGVRIQYRPIEDLKLQLESISDASAQKELARWKKEALQVVEATDKGILDTCRLYILLRSIIEKEGLSGVSIDCLSFSFNSDRTIPLPCLAFTRLRDEGVAAPCEADVVGMLSSMLLQEISQKPSYFCNVSGIDAQKSNIVLRHCVAPLKLLGRDKPALKYRIRDYHGMGGATPEVVFPIGVEVTMGGFTKDLKYFVAWPGRIQPQKMDTDRPSFANATGTAAKMRMFCSNRAEVKIKEVDRFIQNIAEIHYTMVAGSYTNALRDEMLRVNASIVGPLDSSAPERISSKSVPVAKSKA
jgi:L-fucose isomerase-like protein